MLSPWLLAACLHKSPPPPPVALEIAMVDEATTAALALAPTLADAQALAPGARVVPGCPGAEPWLALSSPVITEADVIEARVVPNDWSVAQVNVRFDEEGARRLALATEATGSRLAIRVDGVCSSVPLIREPIRGGQASIVPGTSADPMAEMEALARALNGGR